MDCSVVGLSRVARECKKSLFSKQIANFLKQYFLCQNVAIFRMPIVNTDKTIHFGLFIIGVPNLTEKIELNINLCESFAIVSYNMFEYGYFFKNGCNHCRLTFFHNGSSAF